MKDTLPQAISDCLQGSASASQWSRFGMRHHHGIAIPLFSLRTARSCGIGEYLDLIPLIDWCADVGFDLIQLLPLNDSGADPSPYSALSASALHPIYLSLNALQGFGEQSADRFQVMNAQDRVPYNSVREEKLKVLRPYVAERLAQLQALPEYQAFLSLNPWLESYSLFRVLSERHGGLPWTMWERDLIEPSSEQLTKLQSSLKEEIAFFTALQFFCDQQMGAVRAHASSKGVRLMGDLPILLSPNSADVWLSRSYFDLCQTVGAPPDQYSDEGQNWGFPLYVWGAMRADGLQWWKRRLALAERYYHCYRLDHVVGFYRLWAIPPGKTGRHGRFIPKELPAALEQGRDLMQLLLQSCPLLPIGEDLGAVPTEVKESLMALGIPGTRVMRWERRWHQHAEFIPPEEYPPVSLTTVSNHDSEPLKLWWATHEEDAKELCRSLGWTFKPELEADHLQELLRASHNSASLLHVNPLQEYLSLFPELVHESLELERVNVPGVRSDENWTYRFRPSLEELKEHKGLFDAVQSLLGN